MTLGIKWLQSSANNLYFMKTEVTVAQYVACVTAESCTLSNHDTTWNNSDCNYGSSSRSDHPMNCVNWNGAGEYCTWVGARLPTEDEWYAEASNNGSRTYPWGDTPKPDCDYSVMRDDSAGGDGCGNNSTMPVGSKPLGDSVSGVSDLSGNVWEWTKTESYPGTASARRVIRGGSWHDGSQSYLQASARNYDFPDYRYPIYGFRCVSVSAP
jgi:formylglycine-generating enzyme required for sulfatase activity